MVIAYFVGEVPERGQGVAIKFEYDSQVVVDVKQALREARADYARRAGQAVFQTGGWVPGIRVWFCPIELWAETGRRLERRGYKLEARFEEFAFFSRRFSQAKNNRTHQQALPSLPHTVTDDWDLFGLTPSTGSTQLKQAYRDLIEVWHPDRFAHNPRLQLKAEAMTKLINAAYQRLQAAA